MKKQIAVLMCAISFDNQRKILKGIMEQAKAHDIKIFVFTCFINYNEVNVEKQGAFHIMEMPDYRLYDGIIVVKNTIQYSGIADYVIQKVRESGVPAVCIDEEVEGMHYVGISDYQSMRMIVEHVVKEHQKRKVCYVTGRINNKEGTARLRAYEDTMFEASLSYDNEDVFFGDYALESGRRAAVYYIRERGIVPEAIICANDSMAIGVCSQLELMGYRVPEDIIVTGFDGDELAYCHLPPITTVNRNQSRLGREAVDILVHADSFEQHQRRIIPTDIVIGNSCGCQEVIPLDVDGLRRTYVAKSYIIQQSVDAIKNMSSDFAGVSTPEELADVLKKYVEMTDMQYFYLCLGNYDEIFRWKERKLDGRIPEGEQDMAYTGEVKVVLAYEEGEFRQYGNINKQDIIPPVCRSRMKSDLLVVAPVFYQKLCYGYCVSCNSEFPMQSELFYSWVMNIGIGLENIRKQALLQETVNELNSMWVYDMLTHLYNRAGFYHYAEPMLEQLKQDDAEVFVMFTDIDRLKYVNDSFGHNQGDVYIREIADALRGHVGEDQLLMRYGGDEFVVFGKSPGSDAVERQIADIREDIAARNKKSNHIFHMEASIGYTTYRARQIEDLNEIMELADERMYKDKRTKRQRETVNGGFSYEDFRDKN